MPLESDECDEDEDARFWLRFPFEVDPSVFDGEDEDATDEKVAMFCTSFLKVSARKRKKKKDE